MSDFERAYRRASLAYLEQEVNKEKLLIERLVDSFGGC
jgi:hypothetical protein